MRAGHAERFAQRRAAAVPLGLASATPIVAAHAENARLWDMSGREFIDFASGIATLNVGHRHPAVLEAVRRQLTLFTHTCFQIVAYEPYVALAERLNALAPVEPPAKTLFLSTGAEAVENAIKIARAATGRSAIVAFGGGFHGRTFLALSLTGKVTPYRHGQARAADIFHIPFPADYHGRCLHDVLRALQELEYADVDPGSIAAVIVEPVQGEGGFHIAPRGLMHSLRSFCDRHGILLIADEIQTGFGRTGRYFALEHHDVGADLVTMAKSLGGGFPIAAITGRSALMDALPAGGLGTTFGGSPIACAAALAVLDVIEREKLLDRSEELGALAREKLGQFAADPDLVPITNVRGLGSMNAFDLLRLEDGRPDPETARSVIARAAKEGLILLSCGRSGETIRLLYPLTIDAPAFEEGFARLRRSLLRRP